MVTITVTEEEDGQRLDKFLHRHLPDAPASFFYRMLRKKNITRNGKKADGGDHVEHGDEIAFYLSDDTLTQFGGRSSREKVAGISSGKSGRTELAAARQAFHRINRLYTFDPVLYEDEGVLLVHKLPGILSQKAHPEDVSMNEWLLGYLAEKDELSEERYAFFHPSVSNRLDRNTGGILFCAKTLPASRALSALLRERSLHKYYQMAVRGKCPREGVISGYLKKNSRNNTVTYSPVPTEGAAFSKTVFTTLEEGKVLSLLEAELITGRTHQLRAHLAATGHPIAGDAKYGDPQLNSLLSRKFGIQGQMLYACRVEFPALDGVLAPLSGKKFSVEVPSVYRNVVRNFGGE